MTGEHFPNHVAGWVKDAATGFSGQADEYHYVYQVVCSCGGEQFQTYLSNKKSLKAECKMCNREAVIYDLAHYPAATKGRGIEEFSMLRGSEITGDEQLFVMYEYSEPERGVPFDRNDITWCQAWLENRQGRKVMILDDETA